MDDRTVDSYVEEGINRLKETYAHISNESVKKIAEEFIAVFEEFSDKMQKSTLDEIKKESVYKGFLVMISEKNELTFKGILDDSSSLEDVNNQKDNFIEEMDKLKFFDSITTIKNAFVLHTDAGMNRFVETCSNTLCYDKKSIEEFNRFKEEFERDFITSCYCGRKDIRAFESFMGRAFPELDKYVRHGLD